MLCVASALLPRLCLVSHHVLRWLPRAPVLDLDRPPADRQTDDAFILHADLPGVSKEDCNVHVEDNVVTISAHRQRSKETKKDGWHRSERSFGRVERSIRLPETADMDASEASFKDGVLELKFGKRDPPNRRRIEIA